MSVAYPLVLLLLPLPFLLIYWKRKRSVGLPTASLELWPQGAQGRVRYLWISPLARALGFVLLVVALARPQAGSTYSAQVSEGIAIQLLVDVSSSMGMSMKLPDGKSRSRMEVARELVEKFISGDDEKLSGRDGDLIGLISFARYADTRSPLTLGHTALLSIVRNLDIQDRPNEDGTAYGDALAIAAARLKQLDDKEIRRLQSLQGEITSRVIILLTDGENNSGGHLPVEAAGLAKAWGCKVYAISLGDRATFNGEPDQLSPAETVLEHISEETGGVFRTATDYNSLLAIYSEIDELERSQLVSRNYTQIAELFWLPLLASFMVFSGAFVVDASWLRTIRK